MEFLNDRVRIELEAFPTDIVASFLRIVKLIELEGPAKVREPM
ncbi:MULTISPECIES: type II toxin-antitoxin system RelE/ParE family toxin [Neorhizobium]|nr:MULTISPECIES: type II toxin-antitoxin system RelE/ParE family toxin [Neorhizobium]